MNKTHFDLFSGIGGFTLAAKWANLNTIGLSENDKFCNKVLIKNFPDIHNFGDIRNINYFPTRADLVTGGFPCQPFSQAGKKKGKNDERYLWPEFLRIIKLNCPNWIVAENVTGIIQRGLNQIVEDLENEKYIVQLYSIPACSINAPHRRDRIWIIAHRDGLRSNLGIDSGKERSISSNFYGNMEEIQQEWSQLIPNTWKTYSVGDWLQHNAEFSRENNGISSRLDKDRIKSLGNAVIPQIVYPILKLINSLN